jgi:hypothetical protein
MPAGRVRTSWKPGQSGNPRGRPKGAKTRVRKPGDQALSDEAKSITTLELRELLAAVIIRNRADAEETLRKCLLRPHRIARVLELYGRLNRELGPAPIVLAANVGGAGPPLTITWAIPEMPAARPAGALPLGGERLSGDGMDRERAPVGTWLVPDGGPAELLNEGDGGRDE